MTFPSLRKFLPVAPVLVVLGIAAICRAYYEPACKSPSATQSDVCPTGVSLSAPQACVPPPACEAQPPSPTRYPVTYYYQPVTNAQGQTTYVQQCIPAGPPPGFSGTSLVVRDGKIEVQTTDGARMSCEKLTILVGGVEPADVTVADKRIKITSGKDVKEGNFLQASAQKVTRTATDGAQLVMEGDVKLLYVRKGKKIEVSTDRVAVNLSTGQVLSEMDAPKPVTPLPPSTGEAPLAPVAPPSAPQSVNPPAPCTSSWRSTY